MKYLKYWRLVRGLTQEKAAKAAGISQGFWSDMERRGKKPSDPEMWSDIAHAIERPIEEVIGKLNNVNPAEMCIPGTNAR